MPRRVKKVLPLDQGEGKRKSGSIMGVDVHKSILAVCILNETSYLHEKNYSNDKTGLSSIHKLIEKYDVQDVAMEATSTYHFKLCFSLIDLAIPVLLACARQTADTQGKKTDKLDARRIALAHRDGRLKPSVISPKEFTHLRRTTRKIVKLTQDQTKSKQRVQQLFQLYNCHITTLHKNFLKNKWSLGLLYSCLEITEDSTDKNIKEAIWEYYPKKKLQKASKRDINKLEEELVNLRQQLTFIERINLLTEIAQIRFNMNLIEQLRLVYVAFAKQHAEFSKDMDLLLSIPGIGNDTAAAILAEVIDIKLFSKPERLVKWAGLAPRVIQSGHRKKVTGKIHKGGNKHLRRALTLACTNIYSKGKVTNPIHEFIKKKYHQKGPYWLAICAGARKLLTVVWILLTNQKSWKPSLPAPTEVFQYYQSMTSKKILLLTKKVAKYKEIQIELSKMLSQDILNLSESTVTLKALKTVFNHVL